MPINKKQLTERLKNTSIGIAKLFSTYWNNLSPSPKKDALRDLFRDSTTLMLTAPEESYSVFLKNVRASYDQIKLHRTSSFWTNVYFVFTILPPFALLVIPFNLLVFKSWTWRSKGDFLVDKIKEQLTEDFVASEELLNTLITTETEANNAKDSLSNAVSKYNIYLKNPSAQFSAEANRLLDALNKQLSELNHEACLERCKTITQTIEEVNRCVESLNTLYEPALSIVASVGLALGQFQEQLYLCHKYIPSSSEQCEKASKEMKSLEMQIAELTQEVTEKKIQTIHNSLEEVRYSLSLLLNNHVDTLRDDYHSQKREIFQTIEANKTILNSTMTEIYPNNLTEKDLQAELNLHYLTLNSIDVTRSHFYQTTESRIISYQNNINSLSERNKQLNGTITNIQQRVKAHRIQMADKEIRIAEQLIDHVSANELTELQSYFTKLGTLKTQLDQTPFTDPAYIPLINQFQTNYRALASESKQIMRKVSNSVRTMRDTIEDIAERYKVELSDYKFFLPEVHEQCMSIIQDLKIDFHKLNGICNYENIKTLQEALKAVNTNLTLLNSLILNPSYQSQMQIKRQEQIDNQGIQNILDMIETIDDHIYFTSLSVDEMAVLKDVRQRSLILQTQASSKSIDELESLSLPLRPLLSRLNYLKNNQHLYKQLDSSFETAWSQMIRKGHCVIGDKEFFKKGLNLQIKIMIEELHLGFRYRTAEERITDIKERIKAFNLIARLSQSPTPPSNLHEEFASLCSVVMLKLAVYLPAYEKVGDKLQMKTAAVPTFQYLPQVTKSLAQSAVSLKIAVVEPVWEKKVVKEKAQEVEVVRLRAYAH